MDGQKNWGKCRFSQRISCLAFSSFRWGKPMRGIPLSLKDRKAGLGLYGVDLVRLIWFFFQRVTFLNEQLNKRICATLLISLREGSCFGVGYVHLHVGVNVKITAICTGTIYRESRCIPTKKIMHWCRVFFWVTAPIIQQKNTFCCMCSINNFQTFKSRSCCCVQTDMGCLWSCSLKLCEICLLL